MKKYYLLLVVIMGFISCSEKNNQGFITASVDEDYSSIRDPQQRWNAYKLSNYYIEESWACECVPPNVCITYVMNNTVIDVEYNLSTDSYYGRTEDEVYNQTKSTAKTVDEAFALIAKYKDVAYKVEVEYDERYGYPTRIFIDEDSMMVDDEIIRKFKNLQRIVQ